MCYKTQWDKNSQKGGEYLEIGTEKMFTMTRETFNKNLHCHGHQNDHI